MTWVLPPFPRYDHGFDPRPHVPQGPCPNRQCFCTGACMKPSTTDTKITITIERSR